MQEIMKDGSEGEVHVEDTIEDLIPHIKKSLSDPKVKYVKVFRAKTVEKVPFESKVKFTAEEEKDELTEEEEKEREQDLIKCEEEKEPTEKQRAGYDRLMEKMLRKEDESLKKKI